MKWFCTILTVVSIGAAFQNAVAQGDGIPSVSYLAHMSDVIIVGSATLSSQNGQVAYITINTDRVVKGDPGSIGPQVNIVDVAQTACHIVAPASPVHAIWFLKFTENGSLRFTDTPKTQMCDPFNTAYSVPATGLDNNWSYGSELTPEDKLSYELANAVESGRGDAPYALILSPNIFEGVSKKSGLLIFSKLANSPDLRTSIIGRLGLVRAGNAEELDRLTHDVTELSSTPLRNVIKRGDLEIPLSYPPGAGTYEIQVAQSLENVATSNDKAVGSLITLMNGSASSQIRFACMRALRNIHTKLAAEALAPLLWSEDPRARAEAIGGLALFVNGVPIIEGTGTYKGIDLSQPGPYKTNATVLHFVLGLPSVTQRESYFLDFWKSWWSAHSQAL